MRHRLQDRVLLSIYVERGEAERLGEFAERHGLCLSRWARRTLLAAMRAEEEALADAEAEVAARVTAEAAALFPG
jgi:hypothetical protein